MRHRIDLTDQRLGRWTVLRPGPIVNGHTTTWLCRCECGTEARVRTETLRGQDAKRRSRGCRACAGQTPRGSQQPGAVRGRCSWCKRATQRKPFECAACEKSAVRHGRDESGRPRAAGKRRVLEASP